MKKLLSSKYTNLAVLIFLFFIFAASSLFLSIPNKKTPEIRSKAAGNTLTVCPDASGGCTYVGGEGLQKAVDDAKDGDIVQVSGTITNRNPSVDKNIKYEKCMVNLRGKNITLKGPAKLYGENGAYKTPDWDMVIGVCSNGGNITVDNIQVMQTLRHGFYFQRANVILRNVSTNDVDNMNAEFIGGSVSISNSIFGGGAITGVRGGASIRMINNTIGMGVSIDLCDNQNPTAYVVNNIFPVDAANPGITVKCPEKLKQNPKSKIAYNMVGKESCSAPGEYCEGVTFADPKIINTTIYGDIGWSYAIDWDLQPDSPALTAGDGGTKIGATGNACAAPNSDACKTLNSPLAQAEAAPPTQPPSVSYPTTPPSDENPQPTPSQPTRSPSSDSGPPITYYLPPTMSFDKPSQPTGTPLAGGGQIPPTPTVTPTPKPLIDIGKAVETAKNTWNNLVTSFINFTKTVLP